MKKSRWIISVIVMFVTALLFTACGNGASGNGGESEKGAEKKIAFITGTGGLGDKSFNDLGYEGIKSLKEEGISCDVAEPKAISEIEGLLRGFAESGEYALIINMGGETVDSVKNVAEDYPEQNFMCVDGIAGMENVKSVEINQTETGFLMGAYAGLLLKEEILPEGSGENFVGAVGGMDVPLIRGILSGYECGVRYINPDTEVQIAYVGSWSDPGKGTELARGMYENGASLVFQAAGASGMGVIEAAQKQDKLALGYDGNQNLLAPDNMAGSAVRGLGAIIEDGAHEALDGDFKGGDFVIGMKDNALSSQVIWNGSALEIPESFAEKFDQVKKKMEEGLDIPSDSEGIEEFMEKLGAFEG